MVDSNNSKEKLRPIMGSIIAGLIASFFYFIRESTNTTIAAFIFILISFIVLKKSEDYYEIRIISPPRIEAFVPKENLHNALFEFSKINFESYPYFKIFDSKNKYELSWGSAPGESSWNFITILFDKNSGEIKISLVISHTLSVIKKR